MRKLRHHQTTRRIGVIIVLQKAKVIAKEIKQKQKFIFQQNHVFRCFDHCDFVSFTFAAFDLWLPSEGPIVGYALIVAAKFVHFRCLFLKLQLLDDFALDTLAHDADDDDGDVGDDRAHHGDRYGGLDDGDHGDDGLASKHWRPRMWMQREMIALWCYCN